MVGVLGKGGSVALILRVCGPEVEKDGEVRRGVIVALGLEVGCSDGKRGEFAASKLRAYSPEVE